MRFDLRSMVALVATIITAWIITPSCDEAPKPITHRSEPVVVDGREVIAYGDGAVPTAPAGVRKALCEAGADALYLPGRAQPITAAPSCSRSLKAPHRVGEMFLGPGSLATTGVCNALLAGTECPDTQPVCATVSTAPQFLCQCRGPHYSRRGGGVALLGLFEDVSGIDASDCPPASHNGCGVMLYLSHAQYHVLRAVALDSDGTYPAGIKGLIDGMRADPFRSVRRADTPACIRPRVPVRQGRTDIDGQVDDDYRDGGTP